jgi:hypothetical protein
MGTLFIKDPNANPPPPIRVKTGQRTLRLSASQKTATPQWVSTGIPGSVKNESNASGVFTGNGTILTQNTSTVSVRNPPRGLKIDHQKLETR